MKAIEAAEHSDVIYDAVKQSCLYKENGNWLEDGTGVVDIGKLKSEDYVPLVPKKIHQVGDKVTFLEALNSGMCFHFRNEVTIQKFDGKLKYWSSIDTAWYHDDSEHVNSMSPAIFTLCEDPSIPPKPTLESLPAWTRCKVKPVNFPPGIYDVIKKPMGGLMYYCTGKYFEWSNVALLSIYNPKTEQWEDV